MNKHSVAIILTYYGKFPNYFPLWLKSAGANPSFTFMVFTDIDTSGYNIPPNVHFHAMTIEEIRQRAAKHLDFEPVLTVPRKLCDYKILYGVIFEDYISGYDFWGLCDCDLIWGDMGKFITDDLLDKYGRLYRNGHLQLFRNTEAVRNFAIHELPYWNISYRDILRTKRYIGLDEYALPTNLFSNFAGVGGGQYYSSNFADIRPEIKNFCLIQSNRFFPAVRWKNGKLFVLAIDGNPDRNVEFLYLHIQKRALKFTPGLENEDSFMLIPNEFVKDHELTQDEIQRLMTPDEEYAQEWRKRIAKKRSLLTRIRNFFVGDTAEKIFHIKARWNTLLGRSLVSRYDQPVYDEELYNIASRF